MSKSRNKAAEKKAREYRKKHRRSSSIKLDSSLIDFFCEWLERGRTIDDVCAQLAIPQTTVSEWIDKAIIFDKDEVERYAIYKEFADETRAAHSRYLGITLDKLHSFPAGEWQKFFNILERRDRKNWGKDGVGGGNVIAGNGTNTDRFL